MDFFDYIAECNPQATASIINSFGYDLSGEDMGKSARDLVFYEGEDALKRLMQNHPDKDIILHYNHLEKQINHIPAGHDHYENGNNSNNLMLVFLMGATILIGAAIISNK
ncbi:MAG: hypothetical protein ACRDE2_00085 [Chitinophagaceae bacterium]